MHNNYQEWVVDTDELLEKVSANNKYIPVMQFTDFVKLAHLVIKVYGITTKNYRSLESMCDKINDYLSYPFGQRVLKEMGYWYEYLHYRIKR